MKALLLIYIIIFSFDSSANVLEPSHMTLRQLLNTNKFLVESDQQEFDIHQNSSDLWRLQKVRLRARAKVGIELPFISKLEIAPFVEFHWKKKE